MNAEAAESELELGDRLPRVMAQSVVYEEEGSPNLFRMAGTIIMVTVIAFSAWAGFLGVDETVSVPGRMIAAGEVKAVRHIDGGTVAEVLVKNGDKVDDGQILMRLKPGDLGQRLTTLKVRRAGVGLLVAELKALGGENEPEFSFALPDFKEMVDKEKMVFKGLKDLADKRRVEIESQIATLNKEIEEINKRHDELSKKTDILEEEMQFREELFKKGLTDKGVYNETKAQVEKAYKELADLTAGRQKATKVLADTEKRLRAHEIRLRGRMLAELTNANQTLDSITESMEGLEARVARLTVTAPAAGVVKSAGLPAVGAVVQPDVAIMEIVPLAGVVAVEARIDPADMPRVSVGSPVTARAAPGAGRFTGFAGRIAEISPTATTDNDGKIYHRALVTLGGGAASRIDPSRLPPPGTPVTASVKVGSRLLYVDFLQRISGILGKPAAK